MADEPKPQGESGPLERDPPEEGLDASASEGPPPPAEGKPPPPRRAIAALLLLLSVALLLGLSWWALRDPDQTGGGAGETTGGGDGEDPATISPPGARLRGVVLREVPVEADGSDDSGSDSGGSDSGGSDDSGSDDSGSDGGGSDSGGSDGGDPADPDLAGLPPHLLQPPLPGSCHARAWQLGKLVGAAVPCDEAGGYELQLDSGVAGTVHVELLVTDHLRGLISIEVPEPAPEPVVLPTVALGPGFRVAGQTVDARGRPVADARVQVLPRPNLDEPEPWRTQSDAEGRFEFTTLPYGPVSLRAIKTGYALSVVEAISPEDEVLMVLDSLIDLEGAVVGDPVLLARAKVRLEGSSVWPAIEQSLNEDGSFVFARLPDGIYGVEVTVPPAAGAPATEVEYASVPLENVTPDLRVNLALVPAFRVPTRVVDPEGKPVAGARVTLSYGRLGMLQKIAETDGAGRARVGPVVPGPYFLRADADGYLPPEEVEIEIGAEGWIDDGPGGKQGEQVLVLARPAMIAGVVIDEDERPVADAEVLLDSEISFTVGEGDTRRRMFAVALGAGDGSLGVTEGEVPDIPLFADMGEDADDDPNLVGVTTDELGRFELPMLLPGEHRIWAIHGGHAASAVHTFELRSGEVRGGVTLQLREGVALTGVIRTRNGTPIPGAQIDLGDGLLLTSDARGVFDAGYRRGAQRLIIRGPGMIPKVIDVQLGDSALDVPIELEPAQERFEGRVVDGNGRPIADVEVELRPVDGLSPSVVTWTDTKGSYEFDALGPGPVELSFDHQDYVPAEARASIRAGEPGEHELVLDPGWQLDLLVRSAVRGDPIAGASLRAGSVTATTDGKGRAILEHLVGALDLEVGADGWVGRTLAIRDDGSGRVELTIELGEGGSLEGTIDDDIGDPVSGATIQAWSRGGDLLGETESDGRGQWRIDGVPPGDVELRAEPPMALSAVLAPITDFGSDVLRGEVTRAVRLRFERP